MIAITSVPDNDWDTYSLEQKCRRCIDWKRMYNEALTPLLEGKENRKSIA